MLGERHRHRFEEALRLDPRLADAHYGLGATDEPQRATGCGCRRC